MGTSHSQGQAIRIWCTVLQSFSSLTLTNTLQTKKCGTFSKYLRSIIGLSFLWVCFINLKPKSFTPKTNYLQLETNVTWQVEAVCELENAKYLSNIRIDVWYLTSIFWDLRNWGLTCRSLTKLWSTFSLVLPCYSTEHCFVWRFWGFARLSVWVKEF